ncbi:MAG: hypothetical protein JSU59_11505 [Nitrospirota bacterium]|nr:MAG: hypothetical protein JSU59_11505 [Nitrospirota bacterium]
MIVENANASTIALLCGLFALDSHAVGHPQIIESLERDTQPASRVETPPLL